MSHQLNCIPPNTRPLKLSKHKKQFVTSDGAWAYPQKHFPHLPNYLSNYLDIFPIYLSIINSKFCLRWALQNSLVKKFKKIRTISKCFQHFQQLPNTQVKVAHRINLLFLTEHFSMWWFNMMWILANLLLIYKL